MAHIHEVHYQILKEHASMENAKIHLLEAIAHATEAVKITAEDDPELCENQKNLAALLLIRTRDFKFDKETYELAKGYYTHAATKVTSAPPLVRIPAAIQSGLMHWDDGEPEEADRLLGLAVDLTLQLNPQQMSTEDLRQTLRAVSGVASIATSMALATGKSGTRALQILEQAHCIIAGLFVDQKSDISKLRAVDSELARQYDDLRTKLSALPKQQQKSSEFLEMRNLQESLLAELKVVEASVKKLPGFEKFQEVPGEEEFKALARDGPVVAINTSTMRSDAIIVTCSDITVVPLPELDYSKLDERLSLLNDSGNIARRNVKPRNRRSREEEVDEVLAWLWRTAVKPILDATQLTDSKRIWWITTGLIGRAPLHAAGYHTEGSTENTMSRVISSYVSSFKVLRFSRGRATSTPVLYSMLLVSASSHPPPFQNIDTSLEIKVAEDIFGDALMHLPQAEPETVLQNIPKYSIAHFACHGFARINDPSSNGLVLVKDGRAATLTVSDIEKVDHKAGAIAYLSACSTAEQSDMKLMDEAIHLANSFQIAGYQHVIGTLWGADDRAAGEVAGSFYRRLLAEGGRDNGEEKTLNVAGALHDAIIEYKSSGKRGKSVLEWGPFIHTGI
ncbi:CHAT domain-containing protein [Hypomontagnella monticulosa]|nr:CHAT domain-containing protein [Hypomontagnella monticulosa]